MLSRAAPASRQRHPIEFLTEILGQLDDASRAAIALIFLNSQTGGVFSDHDKLGSGDGHPIDGSATGRRFAGDAASE